MSADSYPVRVDGALDGASRLLSPVIRRAGRHQERAIWTGMKSYLEAQPQAARDS